MGLVPPEFMPPYGALLRCGECHDLITSHDVSCPHCGKRFTRRSPLKFGGYTSRDMLPEKVELDHAIKLREMIEQTTRNPGTAIIRVMKRIEQDLAVREQDQTYLREQDQTYLEVLEQAISLCEKHQATHMARLDNVKRLLMEEP